MTARTERSGPSFHSRLVGVPIVSDVKSLLARPTVHQAVEYAVGFALAGSAVRSDDRVVLSLAALAVIVNTAVLRGPLAAYAKVPRNIHRAVDAVLVLVAAVIAVTSTAGVATRVALAAAAAVTAFVSVRFTHVIRETGS